MKLENLLSEQFDEIGDSHHASSRETPLRKDAFKISDTENNFIEDKMYDILNILGMDLTDDSLKGTPRRVAKMFVNKFLVESTH